MLDGLTKITKLRCNLLDGRWERKKDDPGGNAITHAWISTTAPAMSLQAPPGGNRFSDHEIYTAT